MPACATCNDQFVKRDAVTKRRHHTESDVMDERLVPGRNVNSNGVSRSCYVSYSLSSMSRFSFNSETAHNKACELSWGVTALRCTSRNAAVVLLTYSCLS